MTAAISVKDLNKRYGSVRAVHDLSLDVEPGTIFGFLGPNGAGKTTTIRVLATLLRPDSGSATVMGHDVVKESRAVRGVIGYMPDSSGAYRDMLVSEYLDFFAAAYRVPAASRARVVNDCVGIAGLEDKRDELIEGLSRGMRQRLGLARCLVNDPAVLILDEPASGLDPRARIEVQEILRTLRGMGKTILISSHILSELRTLCDAIGIIERGKLVYAGTMEAALEHARTRHRLLIRTVDRRADACAHIAGFPEITESEIDEETGEIVAELKPDIADYSFMAGRLVNAGYRVLTIREEEILLEDAFIHLTGKLAREPEPPSLPESG